MPESLDLDALRSMCEIRLNGRGLNESRVEAYAAAGRWLANMPDQILAVLALVEEQRKENERLQGALREIATRKHGAYVCAAMADRALAGSPAEKEPTRATATTAATTFVMRERSRRQKAAA